VGAVRDSAAVPAGYGRPAANYQIRIPRPTRSGASTSVNLSGPGTPRARPTRSAGSFFFFT